MFIISKDINLTRFIFKYVHIYIYIANLFKWNYLFPSYFFPVLKVVKGSFWRSYGNIKQDDLVLPMAGRQLRG